MKMLGNSNWGLLPYQKHLLYKMCILPIALYSFLLWHYNKAPLSHSFKMLNKMQQWATLCILDIFQTSPAMGIKAIVGLIPIQLHIHKLSGRNQLWTATLPQNHIIKSLLERRHVQNSQSHHLTLESMTSKQQ